MSLLCIMKLDESAKGCEKSKDRCTIHNILRDRSFCLRIGLNAWHDADLAASNMLQSVGFGCTICESISLSNEPKEISALPRAFTTWMRLGCNAQRISKALCSGDSFIQPCQVEDAGIHLRSSLAHLLQTLMVFRVSVRRSVWLPVYPCVCA